MCRPGPVTLILAGWQALAPHDQKGKQMDFPKINLDQIPALEGAQALFGSVLQTSGALDDRIVDIMVYLYEVLPPEAVF